MEWFLQKTGGYRLRKGTVMNKKRRALRVGESIRREISELLLKEVKDPRIGFCTVTRVKVSPDLRYATIYLTFAGREKEGLEGARSATPFLRREIAKRLNLKFSPHLTFLYDKEWEEVTRVMELLEDLDK